MALAIKKVGQAQTPSQEIIEDANRVVYVTDSLGRTIGVRRLNSSYIRRTLKAISADQSEKRQYMGMVSLAASCVDIDGEPVRFPTNELQFDALIDRLDTAGMDAIGKAIVENFGVNADGIEDDTKN